ncbi:hypothetical protein [Nocardioides sp. Soil796]|uniref:hypothetical protein n=1 Tax=Nocardioides sp. Soil796 TaxID=1736412 RepID=UPI0007100DE6|nr:hypothetical protein [Nocardioides sp. Soil796]KRF16845.1 hypothetical protein ASH02_01935 [Nocardioides sp. Soil796]
MSNDHEETSPALWEAVWRLADAWSETPVVLEFASPLPRHHLLKPVPEGTKSVTEFLKELGIRAGSLLHAPSMFGSRIPVFLGDPFLAGAAMSKVEQPELNDWLQTANKVETAFRYTLGWLRSSLAGYPILRAPQLAPGTPLTTFEMTSEFIWTKDELRSSLNQLPAPPSVPQLLGADAPTSVALDEAARDVAARLQQTSAWTQFAAAAKALDEDAKLALREARAELAEKLSEESTNEHEENLALPRSEYRAHTTAEAVESLTGPAREYAKAFGRVQALLRLVMCEVFGELAFYGEPCPIPATNLNAPEPGKPVVEFESTPSAGVLVSPGQVVWLGSDAVSDAVRIEGITHTMDFVTGGSDLFTATVLIGTGEVWPESSVALPDIDE